MKFVQFWFCWTRLGCFQLVKGIRDVVEFLNLSTKTNNMLVFLLILCLHRIFCPTLQRVLRSLKNELSAYQLSITTLVIYLVNQNLSHNIIRMMLALSASAIFNVLSTLDKTSSSTLYKNIFSYPNNHLTFRVSPLLKWAGESPLQGLLSPWGVSKADKIGIFGAWKIVDLKRRMIFQAFHGCVVVWAGILASLSRKFIGRRLPKCVIEQIFHPSVFGSAFLGAALQRRRLSRAITTSRHHLKIQTVPRY